MADFEQKLQLLAERGTPVGPEEMIERVEHELAGHPRVVVAKRRKGYLMSKTDEMTTPTTRRGLAWAIAAFVIVIAVGALSYLVGFGEESEVVDTPAPTLPPTTTVAPAPTTAPPAEEAAPTTVSEPATTTTTTEPEEEIELPDYPLGPPLEVELVLSQVAEIIHGSLSIDDAGRFYIGDWDFSNRIYRVDPDGTVGVWAETELLRSAHSSTFGPDGRLYVTSNDNGLILAFDEDGAAETITDQLMSPTGILYLPDGRLIVADAGPNVIYEVLGDGSLREFAQDRFFHDPRNLAVDDEGNVYVVGFANHRLQRIAPTGEVENLHKFDDAMVGVVHLDGVLYLGGFGDGIIYRYVLSDGSVEIVAGNGGDGPGEGVGTEVSFFTPTSLVLAQDGTIYLTSDTPTSLSLLRPTG